MKMRILIQLTSSTSSSDVSSHTQPLANSAHNSAALSKINPTRFASKFEKMKISQSSSAPKCLLCASFIIIIMLFSDFFPFYYFQIHFFFLCKGIQKTLRCCGKWQQRIIMRKFYANAITSRHISECWGKCWRKYLCTTWWWSEEVHKWRSSKTKQQQQQANKIKWNKS